MRAAEKKWRWKLFKPFYSVNYNFVSATTIQGSKENG